MKTLLLDKEDVGGLISMKEVIGAVEEAFVAFSSGQVEQPDYIGIHLPSIIVVSLLIGGLMFSADSLVKHFY